MFGLLTTAQASTPRFPQSVVPQLVKCFLFHLPAEGITFLNRLFLAKQKKFTGTCFIFLKDLIYLFMRDMEKERGREAGRGSSRLHARGPVWDSIPGLQDHALGPRQTLNR